MRRSTLIAIVMAGSVGLFLVARGERTQPAATTQPKPVKTIESQLDELGRIASVLVDGELASDIVTDRAAKLMFRKDPNDPYAGADNYDVNFEPFMQTKKLLIRLEGLVDFPVNCNLWMRCKGKPELVQMVIRQNPGWSQFYSWGTHSTEPTPEMTRVLEKGERVFVRAKPPRDHIVVLAPIRDSLGDVVGFVEVVTRQRALAAAGR